MSASRPNEAGGNATVSVTTDQETATGLILEMGPRTVGLLFEKGSLSRAQLGDRATVTISGDEVGGEHIGRTHVLGIHDDDKGLRFTLRYADTSEYERLLATGLGRRFNRRSSFRVEPALEQPILVDITDAEGVQFRGQAMDLSATGLALIIDGDMDLTSGQTLALHFSVAWDPKPLNFAARVCYCGMRDGQMRYGIDFVGHQTENYEAIQDRLVDYVMTRQREILRHANQELPSPKSE
jgi:hypothetical protein